MKRIGKYFRLLLLWVNVLFAVLFVFCAFSPYIDPEVHPVLACAGMAFPFFLLANVLFLLLWLFMYRKYALLSLAVLLSCACQVRTYLPVNMPVGKLPADAFKLLSYNVMAFANDQQHTTDKPNPVLEYVKNSDADIICLQEFILSKDKWHLRQADVDKALKDYPYRKYQQIGTNDNGLACYSRFPILSQRQLSYSSLYNGSVMYQLDINGDTVAVINNHLESNKLTYEDKKVYVDMLKDPEKGKVEYGTHLLIAKLAEAMAIRARQAQLISHVVDSLQACGRKVIVCGDFNDTPISYTHRLISKKLHDAFVRSGNGLGVSYNQNGFNFRIDNILVSKDWRTYRCTVDNSVKGSDHYPIWCYISSRDK